MYTAALSAGYLARTPCVGIKLPRLPKHEMLFLDAGQVRAPAEAIPAPYSTLVYLLAYGGLRWGEAAALRRSRCDLLRSRIEVAESLAEISGKLLLGTTKTHEVRRTALPGFLRDLLAQHFAEFPGGPDAVVFTAPAGGMLRHSNFYHRTWKPAVVAAGLPSGLRIHDLRHTAHGRRPPDRPGRPPQGGSGAPRALRDPGDDGSLRPPVPG